jgi:hypothetical protein
MLFSPLRLRSPLLLLPTQRLSPRLSLRLNLRPMPHLPPPTTASTPTTVSYLGTYTSNSY